MPVNGNKLMSLSEAASLVEDGATVAIGGAALRRKPVRMVLELARQCRRGLHLWTFVGSLDVDILVGSGCADAVSYSYVGFEHHGLAPRFSRAAREGKIEANEYSEWMFVGGVRAAVMGIPFLPTHAGRGSDLVQDRGLKEITCPYTGETLLAVPASRFDVAIIHAWRADARGNVQNPEFPDHLIELDYLMARAARHVIVTVEKVASAEQIEQESYRTVLFPFEVTAVVEAKRGARPTAVPPVYPCDTELIDEYMNRAESPEQYSAFLQRLSNED
ncbi:MAG: CoA transferase subunit A [Acidobacteria bacterium]|nr:CoA transferase subunit A [Acidobacteriota bacterium]